jgi:hypothetical protein
MHALNSIMRENIANYVALIEDRGHLGKVIIILIFTKR